MLPEPHFYSVPNVWTIITIVDYFFKAFSRETCATPPLSIGLLDRFVPRRMPIFISMDLLATVVTITTVESKTKDVPIVGGNQMCTAYTAYTGWSGWVVTGSGIRSRGPFGVQLCNIVVKFPTIR